MVHFGFVAEHREYINSKTVKLDDREKRCIALNTSDFFGFRFFGFHFEYGLTTDETYSRRQINTGTKFEVSHLHNIFVDIGQSGLFMD